MEKEIITYRRDRENRWYRRDTQGRYINYYINGTLTEDREGGYYNSISEERWNKETSIDTEITI